MKFNDHGAETDNIFIEFNVQKPDEVIDFSTNTNVISCDYDIKKVVNSIDISSYPDSSNSQVIKAIQSNINRTANVEIDSKNIMVTNGSNEAIYLIASYFVGEEIAILQPTYPEYEKAFVAYDAHVNDVYNLVGLVDDKYKAVVICNPNNPTGQYIKVNKLLKTIEEIEAKGITIIIDEAYIDFLIIEDKSLISYLNKFENLIILRSLTKIYQLAGLRLGYVLTSNKWIDKISRRQATWSVNSVASNIAIKYLGNTSLVEDTKAFYRSEALRIRTSLEELGMNFKLNDVNFYLLKTTDDVKLIRYLLSKGIIVRHTRNHPGLDGKYVRIAIRSEVENDYLIKTLEDYTRG